MHALSNIEIVGITLSCVAVGALIVFLGFTGIEWVLTHRNKFRPLVPLRESLRMIRCPYCSSLNTTSLNFWESHCRNCGEEYAR